ncbi:radical SAM protein [Anaeromassilibacillus sp. SJQ-1]|uniref:radical SAM protein n=1 Tax=Anaeromassilibacillus sp. SJQ-1 TaxID=3375419 RepID=UPI003988C5BB
MYNPKSPIATEFIDDEEIRDTLRYAEENKDNLELVNRLIDKTDELKGLTHREAAVLLACEDKDALERIFAQATKIKQEFYGNRIVMFAPLYLSNYCVNGCTYCPYHKKNGHIARKKLTQDEIRREVIALQDMGHKRLALETGEEPCQQSNRRRIRRVSKPSIPSNIKMAQSAVSTSISLPQQWKITAN